MSTAIVTSDTSLNHNTGTGHPEKPDRVTVVINNLKRNKQLIWKKPVKFNKNILNITHTAEYIKNVQNSYACCCPNLPPAFTSDTFYKQEYRALLASPSRNNTYIAFELVSDYRSSASNFVYFLCCWLGKPIKPRIFT